MWIVRYTSPQYSKNWFNSSLVQLICSQNYMKIRQELLDILLTNKQKQTDRQTEAEVKTPIILKFMRSECVWRWSGGSCQDTETGVPRRSSATNHDRLTFIDVSALFLAVAVVIVCVFTTLTLSIVRCRQPRDSNDQASSVSLITGPPNGPLLFCSLASVVCRRRLWRCRPASRPVAGSVGGRRAGSWAAHTARRASTVTSR